MIPWAFEYLLFLNLALEGRQRERRADQSGATAEVCVTWCKDMSQGDELETYLEIEPMAKVEHGLNVCV